MPASEAAARAATIKERQRIRAQAFMGRSMVGRSVVRGKITATITDGPHLHGDGNAIRVTVKLTRAGKDVTPQDLNPVVIVNPPLLVPDGPPSARRYREDPEAVLLGVIADLLR